MGSIINNKNKQLLIEMSNLEQLLGKEHPDVGYLKKEEISSVLCQALSKTYMAQPNDPVQFFSRYLLNHVA